ncbi:MAG: toll/interleukin-1 receptor domain-containing protein [Methylococcaceae bacterium]|nr:toll/interleukin-1 receptor domain-containing protein [Methylococcaceae bacterium]
MARAFMSYSSKDETFADLVRLKLESAGIQVWIDNSELHAGEEWRNAIDDGISSSNVLLVILTQQSCLSSYVTYEWAYALGKGIKIIPLLRENCDMHPRLAVLQYLDFRDQRKGPWDLLADEIRTNNSTEKPKNSSTYVRDMTTEELQSLINSAVSLATAMKRTSGQTSTSENITQAAKTVIDVMQHARDMPSRSATNSKPRLILWVDDQPNNNIHERATFEAMGCNFILAQSTRKRCRC